MKKENASSHSRKRVVVLGAGMSGLSAAYRLSNHKNFEVHVVEKEADAGGVCRSFQDGDFILDYGPHKFYSLVDGVMDEMKDLMGEDLLERDKSQSIYLRGGYYAFPLKMSEMLLRFSPLQSFKLFGSYALQLVRNKFSKLRAESYEQFLIERFGRGIYRTIFEPMAHKMFGSPRALDRKLAEVRIASPSFFAVLKQLFLPTENRNVSAPTFYYPKMGYGMIPRRLHDRSQANGVNFHFGSTVKAVETSAGAVSTIVFEDEEGNTHRLECDYVIYTIPLSIIGNLVQRNVPTNLRKASQGIAYRHSIVYYFLLKSKPVLPSMWVFFPERRFRFGRLSEMEKFSPSTTPTGYTALMADFTCETTDEEWTMDDNTLGDILMAQMMPLKLFKPEQVVKRFSRRLPNFYPTYSIGFQDNLKTIRDLEATYGNLFFIGRLGDFNYNNSDQCLDMGFKVADHIVERGNADQDWQKTRSERFDQYRIVD